MLSPYDPPKASIGAMADTSNLTRIARWAGALSFGYLAIMTGVSGFILFSTKLVVVPLDVFLAIGFLRLGRRFFITVGVLIMIMVAAQAYYTAQAIANPQVLANPLPEHPWSVYARSIVPHLAILVSALVLHIKHPRKKQPAEQAGSSNGG